MKLLMPALIIAASFVGATAQARLYSQDTFYTTARNSEIETTEDCLIGLLEVNVRDPASQKKCYGGDAIAAENPRNEALRSRMWTAHVDLRQ